MPQQDPKTLLFEPLFHLKEVGHKAPLFDSQTDLAQAIVDNSQGHYRQLSSILPLLSKGLKPVGVERTPLPKKLIDTLFYSVEHKLTNQEDVIYFKEEFTRSLSKSISETSPYKKVMESLDTFNKCIEEATDHYAYSAIPAELVWKKEKSAESLVRKLCEGLINESKLTNYTFYVCDFKVAVQFWKSLYEYMVTEMQIDAEIVQNTLLTANEPSRENGKLAIKVAQDQDFIIHFSFFEKRENQKVQQAHLFTIEFHQDELSVVQYNEKTKDDWYYKRAMPLFMDEKTTNKVKSILFNDVCEHLLCFA